ncbi:hypothetical protein YPPY71_0596 [Yersinia pestis PY-71]|uniref:Uncharacterized protein n=13 Tax=Yersinia pseudotuberculosis complex TaxID=1649845 RepID=Q8CKE0_YERPE|nr:hypothetical [Yersinia pestis KIM10+]AAS63811.1 hypothetical protein YP_3663 [Yersinia pestis biovar Microtus str. 91001]EIR68763.1 hypothetical protein YPPY25_0741 [Yersinia pestis PY-25]EIS23491.1 hypothetical protein YPPY53_0687 [Yersinia pestis PY-53]EIS80927.1 hypothetical protein YPPY71_0596 [Yersinia pestis PY-71]EIT61952.1 hypothetical protein YPPY103_0730 [Yersinia pestis PY-103]QOW15820.1 hypothetical protein S96127_3518 [Yersinia pestis]
MQMLDPKNIQNVLKSSTDLGQQSQSDLQKPFVKGMQNMEMSGADAARSIMQSVNQSCETMMSDMNKILGGLQDNVDAHQKMQSEERPKDFERAMSDLRSTLSNGFPEEMKSMFDKLPKM